ncbi:MAG: hypothetical protein ACLSUW_00185 [Akkermansia sp.]
MNSNSSHPRLPFPQYVMTQAHAAALRSEDPYRKVGAAPWMRTTASSAPLTTDCIPDSRLRHLLGQPEERQKYMLHAEINLCSLFRSGEAKVVACTTMPCTSCMQALCAHGVKTIYYCEPYDKPKLCHRQPLRRGTDPGYGLSAQPTLPPCPGQLMPGKSIPVHTACPTGHGAGNAVNGRIQIKPGFRNGARSNDARIPPGVVKGNVHIRHGTGGAAVGSRSNIQYAGISPLLNRYV